jgi:hypothetical protein
MTQADRVISTPQTNTPTSRRRFLSTTATLAAGGAALGLAIPPALATTDPVFDAIEKHKIVHAAFLVALDQYDDHEDAYTDDAVKLAFDAEIDAACAILSIRATTAAGLVALLRYVTEADTDGMGWPDQLQSEDGKLVRSWHYFLVENLAESSPAGSRRRVCL